MNYRVTDTELRTVADAIRTKADSEDLLAWPNGFASKVSEIPSELATKSITANGTYIAVDDEVDGYSAVNVAVPNSYVSSDEGKVVSNGALVAQTSLSINENGTYDTTTNDEVSVNVSGGGGGSKNILHGYVFPDDTEGENGDIYLLVEMARLGNTGTGYINTGVVATGNVDIDMVFIFNSAPTKSTPGVLISGRGSGVGTGMFIGSYSGVTSNAGIVDFGTSGSSSRKAWPYTVGGVGHLQIKDGVLSDSFGNTLEFNTEWTTENEICLFKDVGQNQTGNALLFYLKIWSDGELVRDYTPALDGNTACLYDAVNDSYVYASGGTLAYNDSNAGNIMDVFLKVNGEWVPIEGQDIDDVNTQGVSV